MDLKGEVAGRYIRIVAVIALMLGLSDAARLLGVGAGPVSPLTLLGTGGFVSLATFGLARLFAAVGLWIRASWGAVLLVGATVVELVLFLTGSPDVQMTWFGFGVRVALLLSISLIFFLGLRFRRAQD
jgi:hypothetical protein